MWDLQHLWKQISDVWQGKAMLSTILDSLFQAMQNLSAVFGANVYLVLLLLTFIWIDLGLGVATAVKRHRPCYKAVYRSLVKLPLYCLYLFLVGSVSVSIEHSIYIALPLLNAFIAYLIISEVLIVVHQLQVLQVRVPPLLVVIAKGASTKLNAMVHRYLKEDKQDVPERPDKPDRRDRETKDG